MPFTNFSFYGLSLFAVFYGLDWIATVPPTVKLTANRFGPEKAGMVFGWVFAGHQIGAASAAFGAGLIRTEYDDLPAGLLRRRRAVHHRCGFGADGAEVDAQGCSRCNAGACSRLEHDPEKWEPVSEKIMLKLKDQRRFSAILSQISAAMSAPPKFFTARMPVGEVTLISVR